MRAKVAVAACVLALSVVGCGTPPSSEPNGGVAIASAAQVAPWRKVKRNFLFAIGDAFDACRDKSRKGCKRSKSAIGLKLLEVEGSRWAPYEERLKKLADSGLIDEFD
jgi:hypothetical protein